MRSVKMFVIGIGVVIVLLIICIASCVVASDVDDELEEYWRQQRNNPTEKDDLDG